MKKQFSIEVKRSRTTGNWFWVMKGANGEKMAHSEGIENRTYLKALLKRFEKMGFIIK
jgi:uncharacterized protein YegP (UPF0339 family)